MEERRRTTRSQRTVRKVRVRQNEVFFHEKRSSRRRGAAAVETAVAA